jgi:hypothetical protein
MRKIVQFHLFRKSSAGRSSRALRGRSSHPAVEALEGRQLMTAAAISAVQQYGIPSIFSIDQSGSVSYDFLTVSGTQVGWNGWVPVSGGVDATAISTGTVLVSPTLRPYVFLLNSADNIYYNVGMGGGSFTGWSPVGINVGATAISTGVIPIANNPYVFLINTAKNIYYSSQTANGSWAGWSPVGVNVGATAISTGVVQVSTSPAIFEPYVFMTNTARDVYFEVRNTNGSWSGWSPVGISVGALAISALTLHNKPYVVLQNDAGNIYVNFEPSKGTWAGWSPVGKGTGATPALEMAATTSDSSIYNLAINGAGQVNSTFGNYGSWSSWFGLGVLPTGVLATTVSVTSGPVSAPFAFTIGADGNVYWNDQSSWAAWNQWASIGAPS